MSERIRFRSARGHDGDTSSAVNFLARVVTTVVAILVVGAVMLLALADIHGSAASPVADSAGAPFDRSAASDAPGAPNVDRASR